MSSDLRHSWKQHLVGRVHFVALGHTAIGDDAAGLHLGGRLAAAGLPVAIAGTAPERLLAKIARDCDHVVFLDTVDFGGAPGDVTFLGSAEMASRFPQLSTHRLSLGLLARWLESTQPVRAWLLGIQPASLRPGRELSEPVRQSCTCLHQLLVETFAPPASGVPPEQT